MSTSSSTRLASMPRSLECDPAEPANPAPGLTTLQTYPPRAWIASASLSNRTSVITAIGASESSIRFMVAITQISGWIVSRPHSVPIVWRSRRGLAGSHGRSRSLCRRSCNSATDIPVIAEIAAYKGSANAKTPAPCRAASISATVFLPHPAAPQRPMIIYFTPATCMAVRPPSGL
ncbi:MAG: hypothetical protein EBR82_64170 [Caulobacteraceae bacterium]|nr:hypothetical protein [Caulobacteraceae bacterium]